MGVNLAFVRFLLCRCGLVGLNNGYVQTKKERVLPCRCGSLFFFKAVECRTAVLSLFLSMVRSDFALRMNCVERGGGKSAGGFHSCDPRMPDKSAAEQEEVSWSTGRANWLSLFGSKS